MYVYSNETGIMLNLEPCQTLFTKALPSCKQVILLNQIKKL